MKAYYIILPLSGLILIVIILALLMARSVDGFDIAWKSENALPRRSGSLLYVALGDSAAQGVGATTQHRGYVGLIRAALARRGRDVQVINLSKSGAKIGDVLRDQLPAMNALQPDIITIEIGANDISDFDPKRFETEMDSLMSLLPKHTIISDLPFFGGRTQLPLLGGGEPERRVKRANQIMQRLAAKHDIELAELHAQTAARNRYPWTYAIDYFHPNDLGYQAWADAFLKKL